MELPPPLEGGSQGRRPKEAPGWSIHPVVSKLLARQQYEQRTPAWYELLALANAPWPLEELFLSGNDFRGPAAWPALAALSRRGVLRRLGMLNCSLSAASFKALVEAAWPALISLRANSVKVEFDGPHALGAAASASFPALEALDLSGLELCEACARLLASQSWPRLRRLDLVVCGLAVAALAALAHGAWPALERLDLRHNHNGLAAPPTLEDVRCWAPALEELLPGEADVL